MLDRHQAIIWIKTRMLPFGPVGTNCIEILIEIHFQLRKYISIYRLENGSHSVSGLNVLSYDIFLKLQQWNNY